MSDWPRKSYYRLPYAGRCLVASLRGWQLQHRRYSTETDGLVEAAARRERWTEEQWSEWQRARLHTLLERAVTRVPFYREYWRGRTGWENLSEWPILRKEALRRRPRDFVRDDHDLMHLFCDQTSGTTGTPLEIWSSRATLNRWYALFERRWRHWAGVSRNDRWAILGGQLVVPQAQSKPPFWVWNGSMHQLYLSAYHISAANAWAYLEAIRRHDVKYLWGYASSLHALARFAADQSLAAPRVHAAISNAEPLFDYQREVIARVFGCDVRDTYGMAEMVAGASECDAHRLHLWPEAGIVEVLADNLDTPVAPGEIGRLICTGLVNDDMPLIRYELGDRGALSPSTEHCTCGCTLPLLRSIEGRSDDVLFTADGRWIGRLNTIFNGDMPICEAQIVQESFSRVRVLVVPAAEFGAECKERIRARLRERVGDMAITVEACMRLPRTANGKLRAVVCAIPRKELAASRLWP